MDFKENNNVFIAGRISGLFSFRDKVNGENLYDGTISTKRHSGVEDIIPIVVSERFVSAEHNYIGRFAKITGRFCSYNFDDESGHHLGLYVFAQEFELLECELYENKTHLNGYTCKIPTYRITPYGREISDMMLAVGNPSAESDYIPCICWRQDARYAKKFHNGTNLDVNGRIQSRVYHKADNKGNLVERVVYEVSISRMEILKDESCIEKH